MAGREREDPTGLSVRGLTRAFGGVTVVDGIDFAVPAGAMTGFVGGNGAGKTTTMRMIMGVLGITAGEVRWSGRPITTADRVSFGYMPEERGLYPRQRVIDQLVYLGRLKAMSRTSARDAAMALLERFDLAERAKDAVQSLSLGNQQRVQVIAAVMSGPAALILDEPFSGLDPDAVEEMAALLREHTGAGVPVLLSSHQLDLVDRYCDRLVVMARGRVRAEGTPHQLRGGAPRRYRVRLGGDAGWLHARADLVGVEVDGATALVGIAPGLDADEVTAAVLRAAIERGSVHELSPVVPPLSEIFREVTA